MPSTCMFCLKVRSILVSDASLSTRQTCHSTLIFVRLHLSDNIALNPPQTWLSTQNTPLRFWLMTLVGHLEDDETRAMNPLAAMPFALSVHVIVCDTHSSTREGVVMSGADSYLAVIYLRRGVASVQMTCEEFAKLCFSVCDGTCDTKGCEICRPRHNSTAVTSQEMLSYLCFPLLSPRPETRKTRTQATLAATPLKYVNAKGVLSGYPLSSAAPPQTHSVSTTIVFMPSTHALVHG